VNRRALLIGAGLFAAFAGNGAVWWQRTRARHPRFAVQARPVARDALAALATDGRVVVTTAGKRGELVGLYAPPKSESAPLIVHFPGNGATVLAEASAQLTQLTRGSDAGTLCFAPSGFDASAGDVSLSALLEDVTAVLAYVEREHSARTLCLTAFSLGALPALVARTLVAPAVPTVLFAPFTAIEVGHTGPFGRVWSAEIYDTRPLVREPGGPIVVVHGRDDPYFPVEMAQELVALAAPRAELVVVDETAHLDLPAHARARHALAFVLAALGGKAT
jgi:pimeloyl-ACP methyl ester carboxylesterase